MPDGIVVVIVAELRVYGFWGREGRFAELLKILEKKGEPVDGAVARKLPNWRDEFGYAARCRLVGSRRSWDWWRRCCRIGVTNLATKLREPTFFLWVA